MDDLFIYGKNKNWPLQKNLLFEQGSFNVLQSVY